MSDRGPQFTSGFWRAFCKLIGTTVSLLSGFHPESNDQTERLNQDLEATLRCLVSANPSSCSSQLPWAEFANSQGIEGNFNTLKSAAIGMSPFECQFGYPLFPEQEDDAGVPSAGRFVRRCCQTWKRALLPASQVYQQQANRRRRPVQPSGWGRWCD